MAENGKTKNPTRTLTVENFSVITTKAEIEFGRITVLIGPQSTGKSLLCKLSFFFVNLMQMASESVAEGISLDDFKKHVKREFKVWFPLEGWGPKKFAIQYSMGDFSASFLRTEYMDSIGDDFRITLSQEFNHAYKDALSAVKKFREDKPESEIWQANSIASDSLEKPFSHGENFRQWYIPAGRSFFTTLGKAATAFQSGLLDPITARFGSLFTSLIEQRSFFRRERFKEVEEFEQISQRLLGGKIKTSRNEISFETTDGRELPLRFLSSGTQELVPLLMTLSWFLSLSVQVKTAGWTLFIEEPEAHLFPETQCELIRTLALLSSRPSNWVITTHSPYILTAFNSLIMAGELAKEKPELKEEVAKIVPEKFWIEDGSFKAYSIHDGALSSILSESGLIDGEYLDSVSDTIEHEFDSLLRLEYDHTEAS